MHIATKTILFCGSVVVFGVIDFSREIGRLKKIKKEQDDLDT